MYHAWIPSGSMLAGGTEIVADFFGVHQSTALILSRCRRRSCMCKNMPPRNVQDWIPWKSWFRSPKTYGMMLGRYAVVSEILGGVKIFKTSILRKRILRGNHFLFRNQREETVKAPFFVTKTPARHWWISHKMGHNHRCQYFHGARSGCSKVVFR